MKDLMTGGVTPRSDVVVLGMGAAGMAAALVAQEKGADVTLLEKMPAEQAGGNTRVSGQVWISPTSPVGADVYLRALSGECPPDDAVTRAWATEVTGNTEWVTKLCADVSADVPRDDQDPAPPGNLAITRVSCGEELKKLGWTDAPEYEFPELAGNDCGTEYNYLGPTQGYGRLWHTLHTALLRRGVAPIYGRRAHSLVRREDGRVVGVRATGEDGDTIHWARLGVVIATGGFAGSVEKTRGFLRLPNVTPWGSPFNTGDGLALGQMCGADLDHPYNYMAVPGLRMGDMGVGEFAQPQGHRFVLVGRDGRRFIDETTETRHGKVYVRGDLDFFPGFPMWTIFDEQARRAGPLVRPRANLAVGWAKQILRYDWSADNSAEIDAGWIQSAPTIERLAQDMGLVASNLKETVDEFNRNATSGRCDQFGRTGHPDVQILTPPFYGFRWADLLITTLGGLRKDEAARVLSVEGFPIPGLFAAGDVASTYTWALSAGMGIGDALAFGRIAGAAAADMPPADIAGSDSEDLLMGEHVD